MIKNRLDLLVDIADKGPPHPGIEYGILMTDQTPFDKLGSSRNNIMDGSLSFSEWLHAACINDTLNGDLTFLENLGNRADHDTLS